MTYVIHKEGPKLTLNNGLLLQKVHWVLKFNQEGWLKPYIALNTELQTKAIFY